MKENFDIDEIKDTLEKFDLSIGKNSNEYKQTTMILCILATRAKELRLHYSKYMVHERYEKLIAYLQDEYPEFNEKNIKWAMMKAGFIDGNFLFGYIVAASVLFCICSSTIIALVLSLAWCLLTTILSFIIFVLLLCWAESYMSSNIFWWLK